MVVKAARDHVHSIPSLLAPGPFLCIYPSLSHLPPSRLLYVNDLLVGSGNEGSDGVGSCGGLVLLEVEVVLVSDTD
jgi:hypothetical protein